MRRFKASSQFGRNVMTLLSGTAVAQLIPLLAMPILARIYSPEDFGAYGFYTGLILIFSIFATARYEHVLFLVSNKKTMDLVVKFVLINAAIFSLILSALLLILAGPLSAWHEAISPAILYLLPPGVFIVASYLVMRTWLNRHAEYAAIRSNLVAQSSALTLFQILIGFVEGMKKFGLVTGDLAGKTVTTLLIYRRMDFGKTSLSIRKYAYFWRRFRDIYKYQVPASLVNVSAVYLPMIALPFWFGAAESGAFFLVFKVLMAPISLIGNAVLDVFKVNGTRELQETGRCSSAFAQAFKVLMPMSILIFLCFFFLSEWLFGLLFGDQWRGAGEIASILSILAAIRFLSGPLSYTVILRERFRLNLGFQFALLTAVLVSIVIGAGNRDFHLFLLYYAFSTVVVYLALLYASYRLSMTQGQNAAADRRA